MWDLLEVLTSTCSCTHTEVETHCSVSLPALLIFWYQVNTQGENDRNKIISWFIYWIMGTYWAIYLISSKTCLCGSINGNTHVAVFYKD